MKEYERGDELTLGGETYTVQYIEDSNTLVVTDEDSRQRHMGLDPETKSPVYVTKVIKKP